MKFSVTADRLPGAAPLPPAAQSAPSGAASTARLRAPGRGTPAPRPAIGIRGTMARGPAPSPARPSRGHLHCTGPESPTIRHGFRDANKTSRGLGRPAGRGRGRGAASLPRPEDTRPRAHARSPGGRTVAPPSARGRRSRARRAAVPKPGVWTSAKAASAQRPRLAQLRTARPPPARPPSASPPPPPMAMQTMAMRGARMATVPGRARACLARPGSLPGRATHLSAGRPGAMRGERPPQPRRGARPRPGRRQPHSGEAAAARPLPGAGRRAPGGARGGGGGRHLCRAGVAEVKYMLTMGRPGWLARAGARAASLPPASPSRVRAGRRAGSLQMPPQAARASAGVPRRHPGRPLAPAIWSAPGRPACGPGCRSSPGTHQGTLRSPL